MCHRMSRLWQRLRGSLPGKLGEAARDERGSTAIEFAMVSGPFLAMLFGLIAVGLYFFTVFTLENAVETASRPLRTGEAQTAGMTKDQFKTAVCNKIPFGVSCGSKLRVNVQKYNLGDNIVQPACVDAGGNLVDPAATAYQVGSANQIMLVTACLEWDLAGKIPFLTLGQMNGGAALIQASTTFKIEPYQ